ncbi:hypothetical protein FA014_00995 [Cellulomonas hominis]|uniref:Uncharacterized protein n=1 Tax=Cellulomonas hominis TaxID=156981 RepID=A0A7Z8K3N2_9CELL|nr:hypothetical protein [Cellulomonas hominis]TKR27308.1 hypothetical protein FA014_00995 [Cellulomonas hominis]
MSDERTPAPPDEPGGPGSGPPPEPAEDATGGRAAYLPIGIVFIVLGMSGLLNDSMRASAFAFFPVGVVFLILAMQGRSESDDADGPAGPPGDDDGPPRT